jgi:Leucine-rich repeat (LRR) protein
MKNTKALFRLKKTTSIVVLLVTLFAMAINLSSCSKDDAQNTGDLSGNLSNENGIGVIGATVTLKQSGQKDRSTTTDSQGNFNFSRVPAGIIGIDCSAPLYFNKNVTASVIEKQSTLLRVIMQGDATVKTLIPDPKFEEILIQKGYDTAPVDGSVPTFRINGVRDLSIWNITDLTGIQDFKALENLSCSNGGDNVKLTSLNLSKNTALKYLNCSYNNIATLDLSQNTALIELLCYGNPQLTTLNVSKNTALEKIYCFDNKLTTLDISKNVALKELNCSNNPLLTTLNVSNNIALKSLNYGNCSSLDPVDFSQSMALELLACNGTKLNNLDVSKIVSLKQLYCGGNSLTTLDISKNTALILVNCGKNLLTSLDISKNIALKNIYCTDNKMILLDVSKNPALEELYCSINQIATLDLNTNIALKYLDCSYNKLTTLDVSKNTALGNSGGLTFSVFGRLHCNNNLLTTLNLKNGNNASFQLLQGIPTINLKNNASGLVIAVDNVTYSNKNWLFDKDNSAIYVSSF